MAVRAAFSITSGTERITIDTPVTYPCMLNAMLCHLCLAPKVHRTFKSGVPKLTLWVGCSALVPILSVCGDVQMNTGPEYVVQDPCSVCDSPLGNDKDDVPQLEPQILFLYLNITTGPPLKIDGYARKVKKIAFLSIESHTYVTSSLESINTF